MIPLLEILTLAQASGIPPETVGLIIASLLSSLIGGGFIGKKISDAKKVTIDPQPLQVQMQDHFVSRREFDALRSEVRVDFAKLEGMIGAQTERVERKHLELLTTIERAAKTGVDGRVALWNEVNAQGKLLAGVNARAAVAEKLEEIGKELLKAKTHGK